MWASNALIQKMRAKFDKKCPYRYNKAVIYNINTMSFDKNTPYNDLPLLPPGIDFETKKVLKKIVLAREALAKLDASNKRLPNESLLINSVILQEARMSSEIENIVTTNDELYQALATERKDIDPELKEVIHYPGALWEGHRFIKENGFMSTNLFVQMVNIIKESDGGIRKIPGTKLANPKTGEIYYTPPEGEEIIRKMLKNLEDYMNNTGDSVDPLIKMAVIHYQFEAIHPFHDGNGRTGRIINILFLVMNGLLEKPILYLSKYIIENKNEYYKSLRMVTEKGDWMPWVEYMIKAIEITAKYTEKKVDDICDLMKETGDIIKKNLPSIYSRELVDVLFQLPYVKRKFLEDAGIVKEKTAGRYLVDLERIGILKPLKVGREKLYINTKFFDLLRK